MFRFNSISSKLVIVFALFLPILVWQLGKDTIQSFRAYGDMKILDRQNAAANALIAGVYEILMERLATNNALLAEPPAGSDVIGRSAKDGRLRWRRFPRPTPISACKSSPTRQRCSVT